MLGRKRHILTDTLGLLLAVSVHPASVQDRDGAEALLREAPCRFPFIELIVGDAGYQGRKMETAVACTGTWKLQIVRRCDQHRFVVLPKRWIVERTLAWVSRCRRLARDYERHYDKNPAKGLPAPATKLSNIGVELWQHDLWWIIVEADLGGSTDVNLDYHEALARPAVSRYGATSPRLLSWLDGYNSTRSYAEQVKPFGFLLAFLAKDDFITEVVLDGTEASRTWTKPKPIAPYHKDTREALLQVRDRKDQRRQSHLRN